MVRILLGILFTALLSPSVYGLDQTPIRIITNNWTSQIVLSHITGDLLEKLGYRVEYVASSVDAQWADMARGINHLQMEIWEGTMAAKLGQVTAAGRVVELGEHSAHTREDWWYPAYVAKLCPGLPDWQALKKCNAIFARSGSPKGVYIAGPWEKPDEARIRALGLNFIIHKVKDGDALWQELKAAAAHQDPIVLFNWSPNWVEAQYPGAFVEFPDYDSECENNPAWGINPQFAYDCGNPKGGWLKKAAWAKFPLIWPCAANLVRNIQLDNAQISTLAALVDVNNLSYTAAAQKWLNDNQSLWQNWLPANCKN